MNLPTFRFHRDPIATGSVIASANTCECCGEARGYVYSGAPYAEDELEDCICPWCIADGRAHETFDASFSDSEGMDEEIPEEVQDEIMYRTPGYAAWSSERWFACCGSAATFLGPVGIKEIRTEAFREFEFSVLNYIIYEQGISGGAALRKLESLNREKGPTAYLFQCEKCLGHKVFVDEP